MLADVITDARVQAMVVTWLGGIGLQLLAKVPGMDGSVPDAGFVQYTAMGLLAFVVMHVFSKTAPRMLEDAKRERDEAKQERMFLLEQAKHERDEAKQAQEEARDLFLQELREMRANYTCHYAHDHTPQNRPGS